MGLLSLSAKSAFYCCIDTFCTSDINECLTASHRCEQQCVNSLGSFHCACPRGWLLDSDYRYCAVSLAGQYHLKICLLGAKQECCLHFLLAHAAPNCPACSVDVVCMLSSQIVRGREQVLGEQWRLRAALSLDARLRLLLV